MNGGMYALPDIARILSQISLQRVLLREIFCFKKLGNKRGRIGEHSLNLFSKKSKVEIMYSTKIKFPSFTTNAYSIVFIRVPPKSIHSLFNV